MGFRCSVFLRFGYGVSRLGVSRFGVSGSGFSRFGVSGLRGSGFRVRVFEVPGLGCAVLRFVVSGVGFLGWGWGVRAIEVRGFG